MPIHPDLTAYRAVDACGGNYSRGQVESGYAAGHFAALNAACEAVAEPDALMAELLEALKAIVDFCDDPNPDKNFSLALGLAGLLPAARVAVSKAEGRG